VSDAAQTVLVVDDDPIKRYTITRVLEKAGYAVTEASTGAEALEAAKAMPEIVILDVNLPDISGFEVCRRIKENERTESIVVLHLSAIATESVDRATGLEGGADGYLTEPVGPAELVATVRAMLRVREAERAARSLARQWQTTFDAISDGVCIVDESDRVMRCNDGMSRLLDRPVAELVGCDCGELAGDALATEASLCRIARTTGERQTTEYEADGRWYRVVVDPVLDDGGKATGSVYIVSDVTDAKERERERAELLERERAAREEAERANRAKDEFLATISHELRTPLNSMLGWVMLLREGRLSEDEASRALETLERNTRFQAQLISDILDVSRIITGKLRLDVHPIDLSRIIEAAIDSIRPAVDAKEIRLTTVIDPRAGTVSGDAERLQQIVWNLLSNAIKFTPKRGRVQIELRRIDSHFEMRVADTGVGMDVDFIPFAFDRFRQADSSTSRAHGGLGLGLAIVRHLAELHGGAVRAESQGHEKGSIFTVVLPISPVDDGEPEIEGPPPVEPPARSHGLTPLDGVRIVVAEDDADTRTLMGAVLTRAGAEIRLCSSAREALTAVAEWGPDLLVSDIGMPGEDGIKLIRDVRALPPEQGGWVPAIALTAYARPEDRLRVIEAGFQTYLSKPADPAEVTAIAARLLGRSIRS
jgi:PAS domain S-box-containing protein